MKTQFFRLSRWGCAAALLCALQANSAFAGTVIKLDLGNDGASDVQLVDSTLETIDDQVGATTGEQNTAVVFLDALAAEKNIALGSFTLSSVSLSGAPFVVNNSVVMQPTTGGVFEIYDQNNELILSGTLTGGTISGPLGANSAATGGFLTTTLGTFTGGSLKSLLAPNSASLAFSLTDVNDGAGFSVVGSGDSARLAPFTAAATANLGARELVPEPSSTVLMALGLCGIAGQFRRRRR